MASIFKSIAQSINHLNMDLNRAEETRISKSKGMCEGIVHSIGNRGIV